MTMYGAGPVLQAGPYEGYTMEDILLQDPAYLIIYIDKYGYDDPSMRERAVNALNQRDDVDEDGDEELYMPWSDDE